MGEWADAQFRSVEREGVVRRHGAPWTEKPQAVNPCEYTVGLAVRAPRQVEPPPLTYAACWSTQSVRTAPWGVGW